MNCHKCGLPKGDVTGSVLPQCMCHWQAPAPQRRWVGLNNDDLVWIYSNSDKIGQAISNTEAKLKEKNT